MKNLTLTSILPIAAVVGLAAIAFAEPGARPPPPPRTPPAEALAACDGADEGDACDFEHAGRALTGTCRLPPRTERLVCVPSGHPPPPPPRQDGGAEEAP